MQITVDIPESFAHKAAASGVDLNTYLQRLIERETSVAEPVQARTPAAAGADIREMRKRLHLGGVSIGELVRDGRRF